MNAELTRDQRDGLNCVWCADDTGPMIPVGITESGQLFAHPDCEKANRCE